MSMRDKHIGRLETYQYDVLIIGGGINGAVSAAAMAGSGIDACLIDAKDFSSGTSQESSNLVWGGIKYLESYEFSLVRKLCSARNRLLDAYPSSVRETRFYTSLPKGFRFPRIFVYLGSVFYWFIGGFYTQFPRLLSKSDIKKEFPVVNNSATQGGVEYSDALMVDNDARFCFQFIKTALSLGATCVNYMQWQSATKRADGSWESIVVDATCGKQYKIISKSIVNAAGPSVNRIIDKLGMTSNFKHVFSKGVHLIVPQITSVKKILTFFAKDGRLFFMVPMGTKTCIGTTDEVVEDFREPVNDNDREFLLDNINSLLSLVAPLTKGDIIAERCGSRPLVVKNLKGVDHSKSEWTQLSRKHEIEVDDEKAVVSIFGGKLTDCLNVGEEVMEVVSELISKKASDIQKWYGEPDLVTKASFFNSAAASFLDNHTPPTSVEPLSERMWRRYGVLSQLVVEYINRDSSMAEEIFAGSECIYAEALLAKEFEMVVELEDFLRRRASVSLLIKDHDLLQIDTLNRLAHILFDDKASEKVERFISQYGK